MAADNGAVLTLRCISKEWRVLAIGFGGAAVLLALSVPTLRDSVIIDEAIFVSTIQSVSRTGVPHYYAGESVGWKGGLWHPPTYIYYVAGWFSVLGVSSFVARMVTLGFSLLTVPVVALLGTIVARVTDDAEAKIAATASVVVYVTAPLVVQNGTLIDIDGSMLAFVVALFLIWTLHTFESPVEKWSRTLLGVACWFACLAWVKFGVLPVLLLCIWFYVTYLSGVKRGVQVVVAALLGFLAFTLSWAIVATILNISFIEPFIHNFGSLSEDENSISLQKRLLLSSWSLYIEILWFSPFLLLLGALTLVERVPTNLADLQQCSLRSGPALLFSIATLTILQYAALAKVPYGFPKYLGVTTPLVSALAGLTVAQVLSTQDGRQIAKRFGSLVVVVALGTYLIGDPFLVSFNAGYEAVVRQTLTTIGGIIGIGLVIGIILLRSNSVVNCQRRVVLFLVIMLLGTSGGIIAHQTTADYSTRYFYGIEGTENAIAATTDIYQDLPASERRRSVLPIDFRFYVDGPFHASKRYTVSEFESESPPLIVLRIQKYYAVKSPLYDALQGSMYEAEQHGGYVVFTRD